VNTRRPSQLVEPPSTRPTNVPSLIVEFAGTPRAGKSTAMCGLVERLRELGLWVVAIDGEPAGPSLPKRHPHFNLWAATATSARMIEVMHTGGDVVLVGKGLFDALCWMEWFRRQDRLTSADHETIERFLRVESLREWVHLVFVMTVDPAVAMQRELDSREDGSGKGPGTVVNNETLYELNEAIAAMVARHRGEFNLMELDTTAMSPEETLDRVADAVQALIAR
jgi:hypothetical protein